MQTVDQHPAEQITKRPVVSSGQSIPGLSSRHVYPELSAMAETSAHNHRSERGGKTMKRIALAAGIAAAGILFASTTAVAGPPQDQESALILACASTCTTVHDYLSDNASPYILSKGSSSICYLFDLHTTDTDAVDPTINFVESSGFSRMESVAIIIQSVKTYCPNDYSELVNWANTPAASRNQNNNF
jgi:hypothetical protein